MINVLTFDEFFNSRYVTHLLVTIYILTTTQIFLSIHFFQLSKEFLGSKAITFFDQQIKFDSTKFTFVIVFDAN